MSGNMDRHSEQGGGWVGGERGLKSGTPNTNLLAEERRRVDLPHVHLATLLVIVVVAIVPTYTASCCSGRVCSLTTLCLAAIRHTGVLWKAGAQEQVILPHGGVQASL